MKEDLPVSRGASVVGEGAREAAIARLCNLFATGGISLEGLSETMEGVLAASSHHELAGAMSGLGWPVALTPPAHRLPAPLVVRVPDADLALGPGWQLAADTSVCTGWGRARLDLTSASWDAPQINLRLETWGSLDVVVPRGVAIQVCGATATVRLEALSPPLHGGPSLRVLAVGPTGLIRIRHPRALGAPRSLAAGQDRGIEWTFRSPEGA